MKTNIGKKLVQTLANKNKRNRKHSLIMIANKDKRNTKQNQTRITLIWRKMSFCLKQITNITKEDWTLRRTKNIL
eukprot:672336-Heterocapsa_arctica.AAC.1